MNCDSDAGVPIVVIVRDRELPLDVEELAGLEDVGFSGRRDARRMVQIAPTTQIGYFASITERCHLRCGLCGAGDRSKTGKNERGARKRAQKR